MAYSLLIRNSLVVYQHGKHRTSNIEHRYSRWNDSSNVIDIWLAVDNKFIGHKIFHFEWANFCICAKCAFFNPNTRMRKVIGPLMEVELTAIKSKWINLRFRNSETGRLTVYSKSGFNRIIKIKCQQQQQRQKNPLDAQNRPIYLIIR